MNIKINRNTAVKIGIGIAAVIVIFWLISLAGRIVATLVPFAIVALIAFAGYQYFTRRSKSKEEKTAATSSTVGIVASQVANSVGKAFQSLQSEVSEPQEKTTPAVEEAAETGVDPTTITADDLDELIAKPVNISRLEAKEHDQPKITDEVRAQIEERRKRLMGGGGES